MDVEEPSAKQDSLFASLPVEVLESIHLHSDVLEVPLAELTRCLEHLPELRHDFVELPQDT